MPLSSSAEPSSAPTSAESAEEARRRLLIAQANEKEAANELKRLKLAIETGEFIPLDSVRKRDEARIAVVKSNLLEMPRRLSTELEGLKASQIAAVLDMRMRELLRRFSEM